MDKNTFFAEYKLSEADLIEANITWDELMRIEEEYRSIEVMRSISAGRTLFCIGNSSYQNLDDSLYRIFFYFSIHITHKI